MIALLKHKKIIKGYEDGFSIVEGRMSNIKRATQSLDKFGRVFHEKSPQPFIIKKILYQIGSNPNLKDLSKNYVINKETLFTKKNDIIKGIFNG
mgnify:FL=1